MYFFFFFQAEDGIRDRDVTGVQTCALPIWSMTPRAARRWAHRAVAPLVHDQTTTIVSSTHGARVPGLATPPHRSTTTSPSTVTETEAPTSPRSAKLRSNSSRTAANRGSAVPCAVMPTPLQAGETFYRFVSQ